VRQESSANVPAHARAKDAGRRAEGRRSARKSDVAGRMAREIQVAEAAEGATS
jgi:hypothetical protein